MPQHIVSIEIPDNEGEEVADEEEEEEEQRIYYLYLLDIIGTVGIAKLKLRHHKIWILPFKYLTNHRDQHYRFTDYKLSTAEPEKNIYFV
ncbi:unnamed protein product [Rhizophagus irregularis]|nr:unnamed protein product [Rhizophagus irregularis]